MMTSHATPASSATRYSIFLAGIAITDATLLEEWLWAHPDIESIQFRYDGIEAFLGLEVIARSPDIDGILRQKLAESCIVCELDVPPPQTVEEEDWAESWKAFWPVTRLLPTLVIQPSWEAYEPKANETVLKLDPGMAFGTGTHETTQMMLMLLEEGLQLGWLKPELSVIDVGTGSGILSLYLAKRGVRHIDANDVQSNVVEVVHQNLQNNGLPDSAVNVSLTPLSHMKDNHYDVVLCNIIQPVLMELLPDLIRVGKPGGVALLSGITASQGHDMLSLLSAYPVKLKKVLVQGAWMSLVIEV